MKRNLIVALSVAGLLATAGGPALADKPSWAGGGKHDKDDERSDVRKESHQGSKKDGSRVEVSLRFNSDARSVIADYYGAQARGGKCPPGLAKKHNGCLPPGQAKKWQMGRPLPADLRYYDLPRELLLRLPPPPPQHRYVQIAGDVLMIAVGSSMVVDAVEDILR